MTKVTWVSDASDEAIITLKWRRLLGLIPPVERSYRGSGTIWHDAETGERQPIHIERLLSDIWTKAKWEKG